MSEGNVPEPDPSLEMQQVEDTISSHLDKPPTEADSSGDNPTEVADDTIKEQPEKLDSLQDTKEKSPAKRVIKSKSSPSKLGIKLTSPSKSPVKTTSPIRGKRQSPSKPPQDVCSPSKKQSLDVITTDQITMEVSSSSEFVAEKVKSPIKRKRESPSKPPQDVHSPSKKQSPYVITTDERTMETQSFIELVAENSDSSSSAPKTSGEVGKNSDVSQASPDPSNTSNVGIAGVSQTSSDSSDPSNVGIAGVSKTSSDPSDPSNVGIAGVSKTSSDPSDPSNVGIAGVSKTSSDPSDPSNVGIAGVSQTSSDSLDPSNVGIAGVSETSSDPSDPSHVGIAGISQASSDPSDPSHVGIAGVSQASSDPSDPSNVCVETCIHGGARPKTRVLTTVHRSSEQTESPRILEQMNRYAERMEMSFAQNPECPWKTVMASRCERLIVCPYNEAHKIKESEYELHISQCKERGADTLNLLNDILEDDATSPNSSKSVTERRIRPMDRQESSDSSSCQFDEKAYVEAIHRADREKSLFEGEVMESTTHISGSPTKIDYKKVAQNLNQFVFSTPNVANFEKIARIHEGKLRNIFKGRNKAGKTIALKEVLNEENKEGFPITALREINILQLLKHENVVNLIEVCSEKASSVNNWNSTFYLVFDFCEHDLAGLLSNVNVKFSLGEIKMVMKQLLNGLYFIHTNKILHRDMKAANILITKTGIIKIAGFGLACGISASENCQPDYEGTLWYRPPELLLGERNCGPSVDMSGAGCIMAEMWTRSPIMQGGTVQHQLRLMSILCGSINPESFPGVEKFELYNKMKLPKGQKRTVNERLMAYVKDPYALNLLDKLLTIDPARRVDSDTALNHAFFWTDPLPCDLTKMLSPHTQSMFE